jgi:hypothetical protein
MLVSFITRANLGDARVLVLATRVSVLKLCQADLHYCRREQNPHKSNARRFSRPTCCTLVLASRR